MSGTLALTLPGNRREVVKTTPTMTLAQALADVCARPPRPLGDPAQWLIMDGKKVLDLNTPLRFAGLPSGARLEVQRKPGAVLPAAAPAAPAAAAPAPQPVHDVASGASGGAGDAAAEAARGASWEGTSASVAAAEDASGSGEGPAAAPAPREDAAAAAAAAAVDAAGAAVAARVGRRVHIYSRGALLQTGVAPTAVADLPDAFYEFTPEDFAAVTAASKRKEEAVLMTRAMRGAVVAKRAAEFSRALVRVELPGDEGVIEASFAPLEPLSALRDVVAACLEPAAAGSFYLFTAPPKARLANWGDSFYAARLVPAARVHCALEGPAANDWPAGAPLLQADVRALLDAVPPPAAPLAAATAPPTRAATAPAVPPQPQHGEPEPPREGVRPPGELRDKLQQGGKPKWLKL